jgi:hypothetical protein
MRRLLFAVLLAVTAALPGADPAWAAWFGAVETTAPPATSARSRLALVVAAVEPKGPGAEAGLEPGDRIIGLDGLAVHGRREYELVRWCSGPLGRQLVLTVVRDGAVRTIPVRRREKGVPRTGGFTFADGPDPRQLLAGAALGPFARKEPAPDLPQRVVEQILDTIDGGARPAWAVPLLRRQRALVRGDFPGAAAIAVDGVPGLAGRFADLQTALARRHAGGEREPDPDRHGLPAPGWTLWYPYPALVRPPLGTAFPPDQAAALTRALDGDGIDALGPVLGALAAAVPEGTPAAWYLSTLTYAAVDNENHGGWPFRHKDIWKPDGRIAVRSELRRLSGTGAGAPWTAQALIMVEAMRLLRDDDPEVGEAALRTRLAELAAISPWLAGRTMDHLDSLWTMDEEPRSRALLARIAVAVPVTATPSRLVDRLRAVDHYGTFHIPTTVPWLDARPATLHRAMQARWTTADFTTAVAALGATTPAAVRLDLLAEGFARTDGHACSEEAALLRRICDGRVPGAFLRRLPDFVRWQNVRGGGRAVWDDLYGNLDGRTPGGDPALSDMANDPLWTRPATDAAAAVRAWHDLHGDLETTLRLADLCAARGLAALAGELRSAAEEPFIAFAELAAMRDYRREFPATRARQIALALLCSDAQAERVIHWARRWRDRSPQPGFQVGAQLALARAHTVRGRPDEALSALAASLEKPEDGPAVTFLLPDGPVQGVAAMRARILADLERAGGLDGGRRARAVALFQGQPGERLSADGWTRLAVAPGEARPPVQTPPVQDAGF